MRLAPHEAMKVGQHLFAAASQKGKVLRALVGDPGRVTAHLRPSCGGRLIAALVTRPTSAPGGPVASSCLSPASPGQGPAAPGAQLSPDSASIQTGARMPSVLYVLHFPRVFTTNEQLKELLLLRSEGMCRQHAYSLGSQPVQTTEFAYRANLMGRTGDQGSG